VSAAIGCENFRNSVPDPGRRTGNAPSFGIRCGPPERRAIAARVFWNICCCRSVERDFTRFCFALDTVRTKSKTLSALIDTQHFLVFNGDSFLAVDLQRMVKEHIPSGVLATVALAKVHDSSRFGNVVLRAGGVIEQCAEKRRFLGVETQDSRIVIGGAMFSPRQFSI
jgi:hypothetical protein